MDESENHYAKWKKVLQKGRTLDESIKNYTWKPRKGKVIGTQNRSALPGSGGWGSVFSTKDHEKTFLEDYVNILHFDCGHMTVYICQNS